jgi:hypothetical protein
LENLKLRDNLKDLDVDEKILKWGGAINWTESQLEPAVGSCEHDNEPSGSIKLENFLLTVYLSVLSNCAPQNLPVA